MFDALPVCGDRLAWTMWLPLPGQTWPGAALSFAAMWLAMMAAMMLPVLLPALWRHRLAAGPARQAWWMGQAGLAYLSVWALAGLAVYPLGAAWATAQLARPALMQATPLLGALALLAAGALQFSAWKARHLAGCRQAPRHGRDAGWRHGLRLGRHCAGSCAGPMAALLAFDMMDPAAMAAVTAAVMLERLAPDSLRAARGLGIAAIGGGLYLLARAVAPG